MAQAQPEMDLEFSQGGLECVSKVILKVDLGACLPGIF